MAKTRSFAYNAGAVPGTPFQWAYPLPGDATVLYQPGSYPTTPATSNPAYGEVIVLQLIWYLPEVNAPVPGSFQSGLCFDLLLSPVWGQDPHVLSRIPLLYGSYLQRLDLLAGLGRDTLPMSSASALSVSWLDDSQTVLTSGYVTVFGSAIELEDS